MSKKFARTGFGAAAIVCVVLLGAALRLGCLPETGYINTTLRTPDEMIYTTYASVVAHEGPGGVKIAVEQYNKNEKLWLLPPPTRIGYLLPLAGVMKAFKSHEIGVGICFSIFCSCLSLLVIFWIARKFFDAWAAAAAVLFMAASPMELAYAAKCWQESLLSLLALILTWSTLEIFSKPRRWAWFAVYGAAGGWMLLVKESGAVVVGLWTVCLFAVLVKEKRFGESAWLVLAAGAGVVSAVFLLILLAGGASGVGQLYTHLRESVSANAYAVSDQFGGWGSFVRGFLLLTPATLGLALLGAFSRKRFSLFLALTVIGFITAASIPQYFKNMRYLSPIDGSYYLLAGLGVSRGIDFISKKAKAGMTILVAVAVLSIVAGGDYLNYRRIFVENKTKDLTNVLLKDSSIYAPRSISQNPAY